MDNQNITIYVVEHMEEYLFKWCLSEYLQMKKYLQKFQECHLWITNSQQFLKYQGEKSQDNGVQVAELVKEFEGRFKLVPESVIELVEEGALETQSTCMLDLRAEKELSPQEKWKFVVLGGILGDHPPRDRPAPVRKHFPHIRHLGDIQLATDTAVLIGKLILQNKLSLGEIPLIREPTIKGFNQKGEKTSIQMEGFGYVSKELDFESGKRQPDLSAKQKKQIYMSEGVRKLLLEEDLDVEHIM